MKDCFLYYIVLIVVFVFSSPLHAQGHASLERKIREKERIVSKLAEEVIELFENREQYLRNCLCSRHLCLNDATDFQCTTRLGHDKEVCGEDCNGRRIGYEWSAFKTPPDTPLQNMEPRLKEAICLYSNLEPKMKELIGDNDNFLYFSGVEGHQRIYPVLARHRGLINGDKELNGCVKYDPRLRPWFIAASTRPKDIVFVIDISKSMSKKPRENDNRTLWDITKEAMGSMLKTLTSSDYVNIVTFSDSAKRLASDSFLLQGTTHNLKFLENQINGQHPQGLTNFDAGFKEAFNILTRACDDYPEIKSCSQCQKVIFFLTDGRDTTGDDSESIAATKMLSKIEDYQNKLESVTESRAMIFTFSMGENADSSIPRQIACANEGSWSYIGSDTDPLSAMVGYYHFLTNPSNTNTEVWVNPYLDAGGQGNITTVAKAVFSRGTKKLDGIFLGVVGHTVLLRDLEVPGIPYQDVLDELVRRSSDQCGATRQNECQLQVHRNIYANEAVCPDNISSNKSGDFKEASDGVTPCYRSTNYKFFKLFLKKATWRSALKQCQRDGGQLATIQSEKELAFVAGVASPDGSWIGAKFNVYRFRWEWIDQKLNRSNLEPGSKYWGTGEPNNYQDTNEDCVQIDRRGISGNLNDRNCGVKLTFICEYTTGRACDKIVNTPRKGYFTTPPLSECVHEKEAVANAQPLSISEALTTEEVMCPLGEPANNFTVICCSECKRRGRRKSKN
eukprot:g7095.t1